MPTETYVIKIDTVAGSMAGMNAVGKAVAAAGKSSGVNVGEGVASGISDGLKKSKKSISNQITELTTGAVQAVTSGSAAGLIGMLGKAVGIGAVASAATSMGKAIGTQQLMANAGAHLGQGLRGQGLYGGVMGIKDWFTGRSTMEQMQDIKLSQGAFYTGLSEQGLSGSKERELRSLGVKYQPITQADPAKRLAEERERFFQRSMDMADSRVKLEDEARRHEKNIWKGEYMDIKTGEQVDRIIALKQQNMAQKTLLGMNDEEEAIAMERRGHAYGQLGEKKATLQQGLMNYATMTPMEREFSKRSFENAKAGKSLTPAEMQALQSNPMAQEFTTKYLTDKAMAEGGADYVNRTGDRSYAQAAGMQMQLGGSIEHRFPEGQIAEIADAMARSLVEKGNELREKLMQSLEDEGVITNRLQHNRKLIEEQAR